MLSHIGTSSHFQFALAFCNASDIFKLFYLAPSSCSFPFALLAAAAASLRNDNTLLCGIWHTKCAEGCTVLCQFDFMAGKVIKHLKIVQIQCRRLCAALRALCNRAQSMMLQLRQHTLPHFICMFMHVGVGVCVCIVYVRANFLEYWSII